MWVFVLKGTRTQQQNLLKMLWLDRPWSGPGRLRYIFFDFPFTYYTDLASFSLLIFKCFSIYSKLLKIRNSCYVGTYTILHLTLIDLFPSVEWLHGFELVHFPFEKRNGPTCYHSKEFCANPGHFQPAGRIQFSSRFSIA